MAENPRPPVAIRILRPYATEDELLEHELETVGKTSVVLIGAHHRPTGVILRFEVALASGATVLRGEGRVLAHKENAFRGQSGLILRFTRLDPRSKAVVDRATAMREARTQEASASSRPPPRPEAIAEALTASTPAPGAAVMNESALAQARSEQEAAIAAALATAREKANATARTNARRTGRGGSLTPPPPLTLEPRGPRSAPPPAHARGEPLPEPAPEAQAAEPEPEAPESARADAAPPLRPISSTGRAVEAPPNRAELLERLRERAGTLPRERVEDILTARARR